MDPLAYPIFNLMAATIASSFDSAAWLAYGSNASAVMGVAGAIFACLLINTGLKIVMGARDVTITDFFMLICKFGVILGFVGAAASNNTEATVAVFGTRDLLVKAISDKSGAGDVYSELGQMNAAFAVAGAVNPDPKADPAAKSAALNMSLIGQAAPVILGATITLLNEIAFRIGLMLMPFAIFALGFNMSKDLFFSWFRHMLGLSVSMALLCITITIAKNVTLAFVAAMVGGGLIGGDVISELQQGMMNAGYGVVLSILIVSVPAMGHKFVSGAMESNAFNSFGGIGRNGATNSHANYSTPADNSPPSTSNPGSMSGVPPTPPSPVPDKLVAGPGLLGAATKRG